MPCQSTREGGKGEGPRVGAHFHPQEKTALVLV